MNNDQNTSTIHNWWCNSFFAVPDGSGHLSVIGAVMLMLLFAVGGLVALFALDKEYTASLVVTGLALLVIAYVQFCYKNTIRKERPSDLSDEGMR